MQFGVKIDPTLQLTQVFLLCYSKVKHLFKSFVNQLKCFKGFKKRFCVDMGFKTRPILHISLKNYVARPSFFDQVAKDAKNVITFEK